MLVAYCLALFRICSGDFCRHLRCGRDRAAYLASVSTARRESGLPEHALDRRSQKLVIAGASSLLGAELKSVLEESRFAGWDFRLVDEEIVAGTLTEAAAKPTVIQQMEEDTFLRRALRISDRLPRIRYALPAACP